jgi:hypothetical protein
LKEYLEWLHYGSPVVKHNPFSSALTQLTYSAIATTVECSTGVHRAASHFTAISIPAYPS